MWAVITMDFVEGLPRIHGKTAISIVVDHFSKMVHFLLLAHPYTVESGQSSAIGTRCLLATSGQKCSVWLMSSST